MFRFLTLWCKKCSKGNFLPVLKFHGKIISKYFKPLSEVIQMLDQRGGIKKSITNVTFGSFAVENVSFSSISCLSM